MVVKCLKRYWWRIISCGLHRSKRPSPLRSCNQRHPSSDCHDHFKKDDPIPFRRRKIYNSSSDDPPPLPFLDRPRGKCCRRRQLTKSSRVPHRRLRISTVEDINDQAAPLLFTRSNTKTEYSAGKIRRSFPMMEDDDDDDSYSTDFSPHLETIREGHPMRPKTKSRKKKKISVDDDVEEVVAGRLSVVLQRLLTPFGAAGKVVEGKVRDSLAVVKTSDQPYQDFKRSMLDMIVSKEMVEYSDLQELLRCFLSLNSRHHHPLIIRAFSDLCLPLFSL